jgi:hypothetical protein
VIAKLRTERVRIVNYLVVSWFPLVFLLILPTICERC